jgi:glycosyltransferase involved in cell wall biosynthesis
MKLRPLTIGIVVTREDMLKEAIKSAKRQVYNGKIWIQLLDNTEYRYSIGEAFNKIADTAKGEWILYMGDDDIITPDYCSSLMTALFYPPDKNTVCITSNSTYFNENEQGRKDTVPTGIWKKSYVRENRFDEDRKNQVDTEFYRRADSDDEISRIIVDWHYGYFYRQHPGNVSGSKKI